jgi:hypothetical protein
VHAVGGAAAADGVVPGAVRAQSVQ